MFQLLIPRTEQRAAKIGQVPNLIGGVRRIQVD